MGAIPKPTQLRLWGTSRGVARRLVPQVRVLVGLAWLAACLLADAASWPGLLLVALTVLVACAVTAPPARPLLSVVTLGAVMLSPVLLLAPWSEATLPRHGLPAIGNLAAPWRIFCTGLAVIAITSATVSTLSRSDLREALVRLPVPRLLTAIALQIVMQADLLAREAGRIMLALQARGATHGFRSRLRAVGSVPRVWLPRLASKAERVALAMEVRGYPTVPLALESHRFRASDSLALLLALGWLILAALVHFEQLP
jgi:energy-coupling factor transporter transmembrane protein EcfT